jgi:hypothetical protein
MTVVVLAITNNLLYDPFKLRFSCQPGMYVLFAAVLLSGEVPATATYLGQGLKNKWPASGALALEAQVDGTRSEGRKN